MVDGGPSVEGGHARGIPSPTGAPLEGGPRGGCMKPVAGLHAPWCFVDNSTCSAPLFTLGSVPLDFCFAAGDGYAMDTGVCCGH